MLKIRILRALRPLPLFLLLCLGLQTGRQELLASVVVVVVIVVVVIVLVVREAVTVVVGIIYARSGVGKISFVGASCGGCSWFCGFVSLCRLSFSLRRSLARFGSAIGGFSGGGFRCAIGRFCGFCELRPVPIFWS